MSLILICFLFLTFNCVMGFCSLVLMEVALGSLLCLLHCIAVQMKK